MEIDTSELAVQLDILARKMGESEENAVARWGVATARELATKTQVRGNTKAARVKQNTAIETDARKACSRTKNKEILRRLRAGKVARMRVDGVWQSIGPERFLRSAADVNAWIEELRKNTARRRVGRVSVNRRKVCSFAAFNGALTKRRKAVGKAKGGWIGAGILVGRTQKGADKLTIGKNYIGYAQKHKAKGYGTMLRGKKPTVTLVNRVPYSGDPYVLSTEAANGAIKIGQQRTVEWYQKALKGMRVRKR